MSYERGCTAHNTDPYEAEIITSDHHGLVYQILRCPLCRRPQGLRLIRRNDPRHPDNTQGA